ncbi:MAG: phosphatidylglycerophosphatase A [Puniceicoccales bacterium]|jgi:phosphatidylglycerophosphatase A|nr:phosphatidylglycerophosphatase A [Puniceicoccales bacterium]
MSYIGKIIVGIATLGPLGMRMPAPGTWGSAAGMLFYVLIFKSRNTLDTWASYLGILTAAVLVAIVICGIAEKHFKKKDPGQVILDEFVAMPLVFVGVESFVGKEGNYWFLWMLGGLVAFRFFDIVKPFGIRSLQKLPGGLGIVIDDLAAAAASCALLHIVHLGLAGLAAFG